MDESIKDVSEAVMDVLITRAFDYFVVYPSRQIHDDPVRAKYYGDYGNYRSKDYGVECRSLGGFFSQNKYLGWVYDQTIKAVNFCADQKNRELLIEVSSPEINPEEDYKTLGINLKEQIYVDDTTNNTITQLNNLQEAN